ncbi:MAG: hypothetical protein WBO97_02990 [Tepidiformaceae bacterium]
MVIRQARPTNTPGFPSRYHGVAMSTRNYLVLRLADLFSLLDQ